MMTNILLVCYPFITYLSIQYNAINLAILVLIIIFVLRLLTLPAIFAHTGWLAKILPCLGLALVTISGLLTKYQLLLYYPVMVNLVFLIIFSYSLKMPPTIIERFARMQHPNLSQLAIIYTRKVTICWCLFFLLNGAVALITCLLANLYWWALYNGAISYILIATLMGVEWVIRKTYQY